MTSSAEPTAAQILVTKDGRQVVTGTGFMIAPGLVLTAAHVVANADRDRVLVRSRHDIAPTPGVVTGIALHSDIALIKLDTSPDDASQRDVTIDVLRKMAEIFEQRYLHNSTPGDIDQVIRLYRDLVAQLQEDDLRTVSVLSNLGAAHRFRYDLVGQPRDLDEAIMCWREAVEISNQLGQLPEEPAVLSNLAAALRTRADASGNHDDLDEAIAISRRAIAIAEGIGQQRELPATLSNLAVALTTRFKLTRRLDDLDEAVGTGRRAVELMLPDEPALAVVLSNLGTALESRYGQSGKVGDLREAVELLQRALAISPGAPGRAHVMAGLPDGRPLPSEGGS